MTPTRNPDREERKSSVLKLLLASAREGERYAPQSGLRTGLNRLDVARARRTGTTELQRGQINHDRTKLRHKEHGSEFFTSGRCSGRLGAAPGALDGRHGGCGSPASSGDGGRARERVSVGEMRKGRESECGWGSKRSWGAWAGDVAGLLGVHACAGQRRL